MRRPFPFFKPVKVALFSLLLAFSIQDAYAQRVNIPADLSAKIDAYVRPYVDSNNFSGAILVAQGDKILFRRGYGLANYELAVPNTPETRFHIASISKSFTAAAVLMLERRAQLSAGDPLSKFIPDYPNADKITLHDLLTHRSGIPNVNNLPVYTERSRMRLSLPEIIQLFKHEPLDYAPGARFHYSNSNYNLLAFVIEKVSGQTYGAFLRQNIFQPLAMTGTGNDDGSDQLIENRASGYVPAGMQEVENAPYLNWSIKTGNGSLYSTVDDLYKWDRALYTDKVLGARSREKMFTDYGGFGYGWFVRQQFGRRVTAINGRSPGFTSSLERFVDDDVCIALAANTYSGLTQTMADDLAAIVFQQKYQVPKAGVAISPALMERYAGRYQFGADFSFNPNALVTVENTKGGLRMQSGGSTSYLLPQADNQFVDRLYGGNVRFEFSGKEVTKLIWSFGQAFTANRVK